MKIVTVILARGGSKGIPKKNTFPLNNKPLIYYTINASINSKVAETWVCTDDDEIGDVSKKYGANVLIRPKEISTDTSKSEEALLYFLDNVDFDVLVFIQATSPLLTHNFIDEGIDLLLNNKFDSVFSGYKEHWIPRWEFIDGNAIPHNWDINKRPMRQEVKELFVENGAFYITKKESLLKNKLRYNNNVGVVEMPYSKSFQVDTIDDLKIIEKLL
jgi:CMP-N-acetylneuraminic acid synthetase